MPRNRVTRFQDPRSDIVWAAIEALDPARQFEILRELATACTLGGGESTTRGQRVRVAVGALHEVADILGHSPSVKEYRRLRDGLPELGLPSDANIRRWLGGDWNTCLTRSLLAAASDGDFASRPTGITDRYSDHEVKCAVAECACDLGHRPTMLEYIQWAGSPDVLARPGRRPLSYHPFERFGGMRGALLAAGVITAAEARLGVDGRVLPIKYAYTKEDAMKALVLVARMLGHSPSPTEYAKIRKEVLTAARANDDATPLPSNDVVRKLFDGKWNNALRAASLDLVPERQPSFTGERRPQYTYEEKVDWIRRAWVAVGEPFTSAAYEAWRRTLRASGAAVAPSLTVINRTFGSWTRAAAVARGTE